MGLIKLRLAVNRSVELVKLEVSRTYGGFLEGAPVAGLNDSHLASLERRLTQKYGHMGVHIIPPRRTVPDPADTDRRGEPVELLPPIECVGIFESRPVENPQDDAWRVSLLVLVWHQDDLTLPFSDDAKARLAAVDWDRHARDCEM